MKKIALVTPFLANGGLERVLVNQANFLKEQYDVTIVVFDGFKIDFDIDCKIIDFNIPFYGKGPFSKLFLTFQIIKKFKALKEKESFDIFIIHGELAYMAAYFTQKAKHILVVHENRFAKKQKVMMSKFYNFFAKKIYTDKKLSKIITVSKGIEDSFIENFSLSKKSIETIYNPFEVETIIKKSEEPIDEYKEIFSEKDVVVGFGRLTFAKGFEYLIEAFKEAKKRNNNLELVIIGDGELRDKLRCEGVHFLGYQENPYKFVKNAKLFVMSSLWEGFGNTIVESMLCKTAVLSVDCKSGPSEILNNAEFGKLIPPLVIENGKLENKYLKLFANEILNEVQNIDQQKIEKAFIRAKEFDVNIIKSKWIDLCAE